MRDRWESAQKADRGSEVAPSEGEERATGGHAYEARRLAVPRGHELVLTQLVHEPVSKVPVARADERHHRVKIGDSGAPARSCITYAVACDGAHVRTIEGFEDDPVMAELRAAFTAEHALQCGYCTPGMLVTARDIVMRLPDADEARIRRELSGNLCRCTGYVGIVSAIKRVLAGRQARSR
jgi:aerobic-type carbon monoxide dehydrogenase small subunit (CoxS/CutS family)